MRVVIAGGHGKIALLLSRLLAERGDTVAGLIRDPDQVGDLVAIGAEPVLFDLEREGPVVLAEHLHRADAVVFAAGAGPGSGIPRKDTVDRAGAALLAEAAGRAGVRRYLLVSAMGFEVDDPDWAPPPGTGDVFAAYLRAKVAAERDLRTRDLAWTVLRPGALTDEAPSGTVWLAPKVRRSAISRADVAAVLAALLDEPESARLTLEVVSGDTPIVEAVRAVING
jgi:uncharacterized protein YbjT (DUF2867 family)